MIKILDEATDKTGGLTAPLLLRGYMDRQFYHIA